MHWVCLILLLLIGCTQKPAPSPRLNISFQTHPTTTDPRKAADFTSSSLVCMLYEGLTRSASCEHVEPALAEKVEISSDGTLYTFHLRKAHWSNGEPITAQEFERSWKEVIYPPGPCTPLFYPILNAEKAASGKAPLDQVGIWAKDSSTLVVKLEKPTPYFYSLTAFPSFLPASEKAYSGPFLLEKNAYNREICLKKNPLYWNADQIHLEQIHIDIVPDEMTALQMFEQKELDWVGGPLSPLSADASEQMADQVHYLPMTASTLCVFNTQVFPFQNQNLRKAFSLSIDRETLVKQVTPKGQIAATSILPPAFSKQTFPLTNLSDAKEFFEKGLSELGIRPQDLALTLYIRPGQIEKRLAASLQTQWQELFGLSLKIESLDFKTHTQRLQAKDYQIALAIWIAQFEDPLSLLERFAKADLLKNYAGWEHPQYQSYLADTVERYNQLEALLAEYLPVTPIYHWRSAVLYNPRITHIATSPCGAILFERFELAKNL